MSDYGCDCRYALRRLLARPTATVMAVLTLALGIAATTTLFSLLDAALFRPLPWPAADRLVAIHAVRHDRQTDPRFAATWDRAPISWSIWQELGQTPALETVGVWVSPSLRILHPHEDLVRVLHASSSLLTMVGARPAVGRLFTAEEDITPSNVALLSHNVWHRHFGGRADIVGQLVSVSFPTAGTTEDVFQIAGVLAPNVRLYRASADVILPIGSFSEAEGGHVPLIPLQAIGRLAPETTVAQAAAVVDPIVRALSVPGEQSARLLSLTEDLLGGSGRSLWLLFGGAGLLLLVTCSSVAGLVIGHARVRQHEIAVHMTLGATGRRILRQHVLEHLALAVLASMLGLALAALMAPAALAAAPVGVLDVHVPPISGRVAGFALLIGLLTPVLFGVIPVLMASVIPPSHGLARSNTQQTFGRRLSHRMAVTVQVALALVLVTTATMFGETMIRLTSRPIGFAPENVAVASLTWVRPPVVELDGDRTDIARLRQSFNRAVVTTEAAHIERVLEHLAALPGVVAVAGVQAAPFAGQPGRMTVRPIGGERDADQEVERQFVTDGYFHAMRIPILRGRAFTPDDRQGPPVVIVSEELERRLLGGNAIGRQLASGQEVIGVAANVKQRDFAEDDLPVVYVPHWQGGGIRQLLVRTAGAPTEILPMLRRAVEDLGPELAVTSMTTLGDRVAHATRGERFRALLSAIFGLAALVLAAVGLYGLTTREVVERRREIGVRSALGATPRQVRALMLRDAGLALAIGLAAGVALSYAVSRLAQSLLYEISPTDPHLVLTSSGILAAAAVVATLIPAHRATRLDPSLTLRE